MMNRFRPFLKSLRQVLFTLLLALSFSSVVQAQESQMSAGIQPEQIQSSDQVQTAQSVDQGLDTLTAAYSDKWQGVETGEELSVVEQVLGSNNLIFVVLTVSLIIWFVLLTFLIRLDKKVARIEKSTLK